MQKKNNTNWSIVERKYELNKSFIEKIKEHKKEVITVAVTISLDIVTTYLFKKRVVFKTPLKQVYPKTIEKGNVVRVSGHTRNLPKGSKASLSKVELAASCGHILKSNQTLVNPYNKTSA